MNNFINLFHYNESPKKISWFFGILLAVFVKCGGVLSLFDVFNTIIMDIFLVNLYIILDLIFDFYSMMKNFVSDNFGTSLIVFFFFGGANFFSGGAQRKDTCGYRQKFINSFYKYFGFKVFIINTLKLLGVGFLYHILFSFNLGVYFLIFIIFIIIVVISLFIKYYNIIKIEILRLYISYKKDPNFF